MRKIFRSIKTAVGTLLLIILVLSIFLFSAIFSNYGKETKYIAYIGFYRAKSSKIKEPQRTHDVMIELLLRHKIKELNKELKFTTLKLKAFESNYDPEKSKAIYKEISADEDVVLVIDGTWGVHLSAAAPIIKKKRLPIIGINPNKEGNDYGDSILFMTTEDDVPSYLAAFASSVKNKKGEKVLGFNEAYFVYEHNYKLANNYKTAFLRHNIQISNQFEVDVTQLNEMDLNIVFSKLIDAYKKNENKKRVLFICTHYKWGDKILEFIDSQKKFNNFIFIGPDSITKKAFNGQFGQDTNNELILYKTPEDAASKQIHLDIEFFKENYPELLKKLDKFGTVKKCDDAVSIIQTMFKDTKEQKKLTKNDFYRFFKTLKNKTIRGEHDLYTFNNEHIMKIERYFVVFKKGNKSSSSYPIQLNDKKEIIPNLIFGLEIQSIYDIDLNSNSFFADFYYWIKFGKPDEPEKININHSIAKSILFQNMKQGESSIKLVKKKIYDDIVYHLYKVSGKFFENYRPQNYPFDLQEINITAQIMEPVHKLKISFDKESFVRDTNKKNNFKLNEWKMVKRYVTVDNTITEKMRGEIDPMKGKLKKYKNISFRFVVKRKFWGPFLQVILPILIIGFISISLLYVHNPTFERLGGVHIGIFFSIIAFSIALAELTPNSDTMTKTSLLFLLVLSIAFINFLTLIALNYKKTNEEIRKINLGWFRTSITALYSTLVLLILML